VGIYTQELKQTNHYQLQLIMLGRHFTQTTMLKTHSTSKLHGQHHRVRKSNVITHQCSLFPIRIGQTENFTVIGDTDFILVLL